ncbi:3'-5' exonuclease [Acrasis kona]|uniref:3'-5' exonuclease n=1 Tax=Acrasis kona TaxID=1008807 RepID=A0AAW2Z0V5_9EUKA
MVVRLSNFLCSRVHECKPYSTLASLGDAVEKLKSFHTGEDVCLIPARIFRPIVLENPQRIIDVFKICHEVDPLKSRTLLEKYFAVKLRGQSTPMEIYPRHFSFLGNEIKVTNRSIKKGIELVARFIPQSHLCELRTLSDYKVYITDDEDMVDNWIQDQVYRNKETFIGVDCEYVRHELNLIQISTKNSCFLLRIQGIPKRLPGQIVHLFQDQNIKKIFCDYTNDKKIIQAHVQKYGGTPLRLNSFVDLDQTKTKAGIKNLICYHMGLTINKDKELARSDWSIKELSHDQIKYAVLDAYGNYLLYEHLLKKLTPFAMDEKYKICLT